MTTFYIITPSFNQAQFLEKTITSVLEQHGDFRVEHIVMDGGSTDTSTDVLKKYGTQILWTSQRDKGQSDALNKGLQKAFQLSSKRTGDTIFAYINSDDYYLRGAFQSVAHAFAKYPEKHWLVGDACIIDVDGSEIHSAIRWYKSFWRALYNASLLHILNPLPQPATFIRLDAAKEIGLFTESLHFVMDYEYWLRLQRSFGSPILCNKTLAAFRIHSTSKGGSAYHKQFAEELSVVKKYTKNQCLLFLHSLHNTLITAVYGLIK